MHNDIMAAGSRDRLPMLAMGRYAQWQSRFMRYIDTRPNGDALRKSILQGPYKLSIVIIPAQPITDDSLVVDEQTVLEILSNISPENKAHYDAEKEGFSKEYEKPKRAKDYTYQKEKMLLCKQAEKGVSLQSEQADWLEDTDEEVD
nr:hypothetical protein [Tanacetum cinerariifolium]